MIKEQGLVPVYILALGAYVRVVAIATTDAEANAYCEAHPEVGVIANVPGDYVFMARLDDKGRKA